MKEGITSFKLYMTSQDMILNDHDIFMALRKMKEISGITGVHCENAEMIDALTEEAKKRGDLGADAHPRVRPGGAEAEAVNRLLAIAKEVDISVFVVHLTCREVLWEGLRTGKSQTVSTDHCSFTVEDKNMGKDDFTRIPNGMPGGGGNQSRFILYLWSEIRQTDIPADVPGAVREPCEALRPLS